MFFFKYISCKTNSIFNNGMNVDNNGGCPYVFYCDIRASLPDCRLEGQPPLVFNLTLLDY